MASRNTDITYIRTHEGWLYLAAILDLLARNTLLMAVWRSQPKPAVPIQSDQGGQFSSYEWQPFLKAHNLVASMRRRGSCYDNAVTESFFKLLKRERIRRKTYPDREEARRDLFGYIKFFYNSKRRHGYANDVSPVHTV